MDGHENGTSQVLDQRDLADGFTVEHVPPDLMRLSTVVRTLEAMDDGERKRALALIADRFKPAPQTRGRRRG